MQIYDAVWFYIGRVFLGYIYVAIFLILCGFAWDVVKNRRNCFRIFMAIKIGIITTAISAKKICLAVTTFFKDHGICHGGHNNVARL